jgi:regulator of sirC expression with transglutaminase-like and TPR domain
MPGDPDALLERGAIRHLSADDAGARTDWIDVLKKAPESPAAEAARANLEALGLKPQPGAPAP